MNDHGIDPAALAARESQTKSALKQSHRQALDEAVRQLSESGFPGLATSVREVSTRIVGRAEKYIGERVRDGHTYKGDLDLKVMTCPTCGVTYAIPLRMQQHAYDRGEGKIQWYCPNGHQLGYQGPSEAERERERAQRAERRASAERDLRADTERRLSAQKSATTRAKKRAAAALCPCCNRTFSQLARHMATKHPDYSPEDAS